MSLQQTCVRCLCCLLGLTLLLNVQEQGGQDSNLYWQVEDSHDGTECVNEGVSEKREVSDAMEEQDSDKNASDVVTIGSVVDPPFLHFYDGNFTGIIPDILDQLSDMLNLTFVIKPPADGRYGSPDKDGTWSGMMGELISGEVDIAGPLSVTWNRDSVVKFTQPVMVSGHAIVMLKPQVRYRSVQDDLTRLLHPLEFPVWLMTVLAFLVTGTVLYIIAHFNPYEWRRMGKDKEATMREAESFTCVNSFWFVISTLAWQGFLRSPRSIGGRITVAAWWFFVLIFLLSYTACLTNYLSFTIPPYTIEDHPQIRNIDDLVDHEDMKIGTLEGAATERRFKYYADNTDSLVYDKIVASRSEIQYNTTSQGIELLRRRGTLDVGLLMDSPTAKYIVNRKPCDLYMVDALVGIKYMAFATNNETLRNGFNMALLELLTDGTLHSIEQKWYFEEECEPFSPDVPPSPPAYVSMDLGRFSGALCILAFGVVLGGVSSIVEYCVYTCAESHAFKEVEEEMQRKERIRKRREQERGH